MDVKTLCLGVLSRGEFSGYEIRKQFEEGPFAHFQEAGFGSIYPSLKRLTEDGLVSCIEHQQDSKPDKKVYRITPKGREALFEAINQDPGPDKLRSDFLFVFFFSDLLTPGQVDRLIDRRIAHHSAIIDRLEMCDSGHRRDGESFVLHYGIAMHRAARSFLESHRHELIGGLLQRSVAE